MSWSLSRLGWSSANCAAVRLKGSIPTGRMHGHGIWYGGSFLLSSRRVISPKSFRKFEEQRHEEKEEKKNVVRHRERINKRPFKQFLDAHQSSINDQSTLSAPLLNENVCKS